MPCDVVDGPAAGAAQTWRSRGRGCPHPAKPDGPAADGRAVAGALAGKPRRAQNLHAARLCRARAPVPRPVSGGDRHRACPRPGRANGQHVRVDQQVDHGGMLVTGPAQRDGQREPAYDRGQVLILGLAGRAGAEVAPHRGACLRVQGADKVGGQVTAPAGAGLGPSAGSHARLRGSSRPGSL